MTYKKMDPKVKANWVAALRSGKYDQTTGVLRRVEATYGIPAGYCCLGVLAQAEGLADFSSRQHTTVAGVQFTDAANRKQTRTTDLPPFILRNVGLTKTVENMLINMNDEEHKSFADIANWIEENL